MFPNRVEPFRLGYVSDPMPGHEKYRGMLCVPYLRFPPGDDPVTIQVRFRCIAEHNHKEHKHGKYNTVHGDQPALFNTKAILDTCESVAITEGEMDAITATLCGLPAVAVAGASVWDKRFNPLFQGYRVVYVLADGDPEGDRFARKVARELGNVRIIPSSDGGDVNSDMLAFGPKHIKERIK